MQTPNEESLQFPESLFQTDYIESDGTPAGNTGSAMGDLNLTAAASPAPEPATAILAGLGAIVFAAAQRAKCGVRSAEYGR